MVRRPRSTNPAARVASASRSAGVRRKVRSNSASVAGSGSPERDADLEAGRPDETLREVGGRDAGSGLYPANRRRCDARAPGQLRPGESGPLAGFTNEMCDGHGVLIAIWQSARQVREKWTPLVGQGSRFRKMSSVMIMEGPERTGNEMERRNHPAVDRRRMDMRGTTEQFQITLDQVQVASFPLAVPIRGQALASTSSPSARAAAPRA